MYATGNYVEQSDTHAIELYEMAAKGGLASAMFWLGQFYGNGTHGLIQSDQRAFEYYALAAEQGDADAQVRLGGFYLEGKSVEQSIVKARELFTKSAAQGNESAISVIKKLDAAGVYK